MGQKVKLVLLYQVVMHYRLSLYERIANDTDFDFILLHGRGLKNTKLVNIKGVDELSYAKKKNDIRLPLPFTPSLFYSLIKINPDVVFSEGSSSLINSSIAFLYSRLFNKKFIWWSLGMLENKKYKGFRKLVNKWEKYIENNSDAIFTYSSKGKIYFSKRVKNPNKIFVGVNVLDTQKKLKEIKNNERFIKNFPSEFNVVFIGSINHEKKLEILIKAIELCNVKYNKSVKLHIIGDGNYLNNIKQYVNNNRVQEQVIFHGRINQGASVVMQSCDVMVLPGLGGLAICDAMLNSLPVITGLADGTEYDLVDESNGFILKKISPEEIFNKLDFLFRNSELRKEMGENSFNKITNDFSFEKYYEVFKNTINYTLS